MECSRSQNTSVSVSAHSVGYHQFGGCFDRLLIIHYPAVLTESVEGFVGDLHFLFVVHVVDGERTLVDVRVKTGIGAYQALLCQQSIKD